MIPSLAWYGVGEELVELLAALPAHKVKGVREAIESTGCDPWYLPPHRPGFVPPLDAPIEKLWSKECLLHWAEAKALDALSDALVDAFRVVQPDECRNYFTPCG